VASSVDASPAGVNPPEYAAQVESASLTGEVTLSIDQAGLNINSLFQPGFIAFADIVAISRPDYRVIIVTDSDRFTVSQLGSQRDGFYLALTEAFNAKVRQALFVAPPPSLRATGDFAYGEAGAEVQGQATVELYDDCLALLPPDDRARRVPLVFANGLRVEPFGLTIGLDGGDWYRVGRLGRDADALAAGVKQQLVAHRQRSVEAVRQLDGSVTAQQAAAIAARMPPGVAVPVGELMALAPSYVAAIEAHIADSRAAQTYAWFKTVCQPSDICVGWKKAPADSEQSDIWWLIAPSATASVAAVEWVLAEEETDAAATYFYTVVGERADFVRRLNRAMEAIDFHRQVVSLPADQLSRPEYDYYAMAVKRTAALRFMRDNLAGRVIHSSVDAWTAGARALMVPGQS